MQLLGSRHLKAIPSRVNLLDLSLVWDEKVYQLGIEVAPVQS
jgi:hypothetical protein